MIDWFREQLRRVGMIPEKQPDSCPFCGGRVGRMKWVWWCEDCGVECR